MIARPRWLLSSIQLVVWLILVVFVGHSQAFAQNISIERVANLGHDLGKTVTVQGRTGYLLAQYENPTQHVFTLTDDYNAQVLVREIGATRPSMGMTYQITGTPVQEGNTLFLDTAPSLITLVYPTSPPPALKPAPQQHRLPSHLQFLPWLLGGVVLLLLLALVWWRWTQRPLTEWGELRVTSGPDQGLTAPLRRRRIALGRGVHPTQDIRLSGGDPTISNRHALLEYRHGHLFLRDTSSNGTRIGGERLMPGRPVPLRSGDVIHLGTRDTIVLIRLHAPQPGLLGRLRPPIPLGEKTMMLPEPATLVEQGGEKNHRISNGAEAEEPLIVPPPPLVFPFAADTPPAVPPSDGPASEA